MAWVTNQFEGAHSSFWMLLAYNSSAFKRKPLVPSIPTEDWPTSQPIWTQPDSWDWSLTVNRFGNLLCRFCLLFRIKKPLCNTIGFSIKIPHWRQSLLHKNEVLVEYSAQKRKKKAFFVVSPKQIQTRFCQDSVGFKSQRERRVKNSTLYCHCHLLEECA